jgi:hypothetical protein
LDIWFYRTENTRYSTIGLSETLRKIFNRVKGEIYRDTVFDYIEKEDNPRSIKYQMKLLEKVGFRKVELLHKNLCFAAFGAIKWIHFLPIQQLKWVFVLERATFRTKMFSRIIKRPKD